jgi:hypothetical protein
VAATNLNRWVHISGPPGPVLFEALAGADGRIDERIEMAQVASLTARIAEGEKWSCRPRHVYWFAIANAASRRRVELERVGYIRSVRIESSRTHDTIGCALQLKPARTGGDRVG